MIRLIPTVTELSSKDLIKLYRDQIWKIHGLPKKITSDRGPQFASKLMKELCAALGIQQNISTAYHPQTDGQVERSHQETESFLRHYVNHLQDDWSEWLSLGEFQFNDKVHTSTKETPFYLNYGRHPWKGDINLEDISNVTVEDYPEQLDEARVRAKDAIAKSIESMKTAYDRGLKTKEPIKVGDLVWLESTNIRTDRPSKKLSERRYGPYKVLAPKGETSYQLSLPPQMECMHDVFHASYLTPYKGAKFPSQKQKPPPPPEIIGDELEYEVQSIINSRLRNRGRVTQIEYRVSWKGYGDATKSTQPHKTHNKPQKQYMVGRRAEADGTANVCEPGDSLCRPVAVQTSWANGDRS
jgi:hypothetical protein